MTTLLLGYRSIQSRVQSNITSLSAKRINWKIVYVTGIGLSVSMLILYVLFVNQLTHGTYLIKSYEKEIYLLSEENRTLETNASRGGLLKQVMKKANELSFEKTANIKYIQILENSLARGPISK